jgi:hypothetical protein
MEEDNHPAKSKLFRTLFKATAGIGAFIFLFGDGFLREVLDFSFSTSILLWVAVLGFLLIIGIVFYHLSDS